MAPRKLRDLIRAIRSSKTAAEEREIVQKECADIRASFRAEEKDYRARNVAKLLYIHMLGYPAHFGQVECLKLVSSPRFNDKRMGHLGTMLLLDEGKELHMMVTNSLKQDMNHKVPYVASMALCTLGAIASRDMARDLAHEVEKLVKSNNAYLKKKATLCAVRFMRKEPSLVENFLPTTRSLMSERHHGILITGVTMIEEMCLQDHEALVHFRRIVPTLVRLLKNLMASGFSSEHDVGGVTDPFLQCRILRLLRTLGKGDVESSEAMNDILAEVATNTSNTSNVGNAVLYEAVRCVMEIKAESGLRVLAINNLGRFLLNNDRNIRYVALTTLLRVVQANETGADAVQRHRAVIIDCLREPDITIRRRALALAFALINANNVRNVVSELLSFLEVADTEFKSNMVSELLVAADKFAPTAKWHIDTLLKMLALAGSYLTEEGVAEIIQIFAEKTDLHKYIIQKLFVQLHKSKETQPGLQIIAWCLGEFAHLLLAGGPVDPEDGNAPLTPNSNDLLDRLTAIIHNPTNSDSTRQYAINAIMKMSARDPSQAGRVRSLLEPLRQTLDVELQKRAAEYVTIFSQYETMRPALLEAMPVAQSKQRMVTSGQEPAATIQAPPAGNGNTGGGDLLDLLGDSGTSTSAPAAPASNGGGDLLDLLGGLDMSAPATTAPPSGGNNDLMGLLGGSSTTPVAAAAPSNGGDDLLGGLFGGSSQPAPAAATSSPSLGGGLDDLLGGLGSSSAPSMPAASPVDPLAALMGGSMTNSSAPAPPASGGFEAYNEDGLKLMFVPTRQPDGSVVVGMSAINTSPNDLTNFNLQVAVPKSFQVQLSAASGTTVNAYNNGTVTQQAKVVTVTPGSPLKMLLRMTYTVNGQSVTKQHQVASFPGL